MAKLSKTVYLTIHGHFYQPPRENPWTEEIELQPEALPFHDWNDRITIQCYQPNAMARVVDSHGKVVEIVNNFRLLSFNVGPTLLGWLERHAPVVYHRILEGDRLSLKERSGHGNALAQVYNHMILPLAREEEQRTQIRWGVFEFKKRFGRSPEGLWLSETAASERTLEILIEEGIQLTILAPEQADRIRPLQVEGPEAKTRPGDSFPWQDVSNGSIDPTRPYRFFHSKDPGRWLDLFFFDGPLSRDLSFGDLLFEARKFTVRLLHARRNERSHPELIHVACDGETFGHHKAFGERVIAFLLNGEAEAHGFKRVNYGEYLEKFPPQFEAKIKPGEGTSWSCRHGVGRWKEDCGCTTGGEAGWNQKWRAPLRESVRFLEEKLAELYGKEAGELFQDPWAARDGYIEVVLDRSPGARDQFFEKYARRSLSGPEKIRGLKLLEMERYCMLTETSCGWFFNDLSGIETVQILRYALRSLELAAEFGAPGLEKEFVEKLAQAKSNRPEFKDGRGVWEKLVKPARVLRERLVSHFAFRKLFDLPVPAKDFYHTEVKEGEAERETAGEMTLVMGTVKLTGQTIPESQEFVYAIFKEGLTTLQGFVKPMTHPGELQKLNVAPLSFLRKQNPAALLAGLRRSFASEPFSLRDLFSEERDQILRILSRQMREGLYQMAVHSYEEHRSGIKVFREAGSLLPEEFRGLMQWMMGERLFEWVQKLDGKTSIEEIAKKGSAILEEAKAIGVPVRTQPAAEFLSLRLNRWIEKLFHEPDPALVHKIERVLGLAKELKIELYDRIAQDLFFVFAQKMLREWIEAYHRGGAGGPGLPLIQAVIRLGVELGFNMNQYEVQLTTAKQ